MNKAKSVVVLMFLLAFVGCRSEETAKTYEENATNHAKELGLRNPLVSCDDSTPNYCTISWEICTIPSEAGNAMCGRMVAEYDCFGRGCSGR